MLGNRVKNSRFLYLPPEPILIVDDNAEVRRLLNHVASELGLAVEEAASGQEASDLIESGKDYSLFIVDLKMPGMDGRELVRFIKNKNQDSMVLICTAVDSTQTVIELMKLGVQDYVIKPVEAGFLQQTLINTLEMLHRRRQDQQLAEQAAMRLRDQLEWLTYKESRLKSGQDSAEKFTIDNLRTSLAQGGGVGTIITLVDMMKDLAVPQDNGVLVDKDIFQLLIENARMASMTIDGLEQIVQLMNTEMKPVKTDSQGILRFVNNVVEEVKPYAMKRNLKISMPEFHREISIKISEEHFKVALLELLINAIKYATTGSSIDLFLQVHEGYLDIGIKNEVVENGGIPEGAEHLVREPFYRVRPPVEDVIDIEKYGLGLGLTAVDFITAKHGGVFFLENAIDHTGNNVKPCVVAQVLLPVEIAPVSL